MLSYNDMSKLSSIKTYLLIAYIVNILGLIGFVFAGIVFIVLFSFIPTYSYSNYYTIYNSGTAIGFGLVIGIIFFICAIPSLLVLLRVHRMRNAAIRGDIATLKSMNSTAWAIIALIFTGVLSGIMLLISLGPINELGQPPAYPAYPNYPQGQYPPP